LLNVPALATAQHGIVDALRGLGWVPQALENEI